MTDGREDFTIYGLTDGEAENRLQSLGSSVLTRIARKQALPHILFVLPYPTCSASKVFVSPIMANCDTGLIHLWIIALSEDIIERSDDEVAYTLAHEIAHAALDHTDYTPIGPMRKMQKSRQTKR